MKYISALFRISICGAARVFVQAAIFSFLTAFVLLFEFSLNSYLFTAMTTPPQTTTAASGKYFGVFR